jgi:predicted nucleic acid-binding protein
MIVVDASIMVSALYPQDVHHQQSRQWLRQAIFAGERLVAPVLLLSEVAGAITRRSSDEAQGRRAIQRLLALQQLRFFPIDARLSLLAAQLAVELRLRGADAVYVAVAAQTHIPLITWDREQRERGGQRVDTRTPTNA